MGVHICVYKIEKQEIGYTETEMPQSFWDWIRYAGDRDYPVAQVNEKPIDREYFQPVEGHYEPYYVRPKHFDIERQWVKDNIPDFGQKRWLDILDKMELDKTLYFYFSY